MDYDSWLCLPYEEAGDAADAWEREQEAAREKAEAERRERIEAVLRAFAGHPAAVRRARFRYLAKVSRRQ